MEKLLMYKTANNDVLVLEANGEQAQNLLQVYAYDLANWPWDLDAYRQKPGLFVWTGEIPDDEDIEWEGELSRVKDIEELKGFVA